MTLLIDIGGFNGGYTDVNKDKFDRCIIVEANPNLVNKMKKKYEGVNKITILNYAVSNDKTVKFYTCNVGTVSTCDMDWMKRSRFSNYKFKPIDVAKIKIDEIIMKYGEPTFIKIDVEGHEYSVLKSMSKKYCPVTFEIAEEKKSDILSSLTYLDKLGFTKYYFLENKDTFDFLPELDDCVSYSEIYQVIDKKFNPKRKQEWGMIFAF